MPLLVDAVFVDVAAVPTEDGHLLEYVGLNVDVIVLRIAGLQSEAILIVAHAPQRRFAVAEHRPNSLLRNDLVDEKHVVAVVNVGPAHRLSRNTNDKDLIEVRKEPVQGNGSQVRLNRLLQGPGRDDSLHWNARLFLLLVARRQLMPLVVSREMPLAVQRLEVLRDAVGRAVAKVVDDLPGRRPDARFTRPVDEELEELVLLGGKFFAAHRGTDGKAQPMRAFPTHSGNSYIYSTQ